MASAVPARVLSFECVVRYNSAPVSTPARSNENHASSPTRGGRGPNRGPRGFGALSLPLLAFLVIPVVAVLLRTPPGDVLENLGRPEVRQAITLSLRTTALSTLLAVLLVH